MRRKVMIGIAAAIVYLGASAIGCNARAGINPEEVHEHNHTHGDAVKMSEVAASVSYDNGELTIKLRDRHNQVPELTVNHEKPMHLIIVSSDLKQYYHFHPEEKEAGVFAQNIDLPENSYKAFVDMKPKQLHYTVEPIAFHVGPHRKERIVGDKLIADLDLTKTVNGRTVELTTRKFEANKAAVLEFDVRQSKPEPYLGALGHVVILDESASRFLHVHPSSEDRPVFETQFSKPGIYKLWAEFKFEGQVNAYPFVIEVAADEAM